MKYLRAARLLPLCLCRGFLFPVLAVGAIFATIAYAVGKQAKEADATKPTR